MWCIPVPTLPRGHLQDDVPASGSGLEQAIAEADDTMPPADLPSASEWAGGESRPCLDSSERKHWAKYCSARRLIPPTRVTKSQTQGRMHGY